MTIFIWFVFFIVGILLVGVYKQTAHFKKRRTWDQDEILTLGVICSAAWPFTITAGVLFLFGFGVFRGVKLIITLGSKVRVPHPIDKWLGIE